MLSKLVLPDTQIILSERFCEVDNSFTALRVIRGFVRNFVKNAQNVGLKYVSVFLVPSLIPKRWDMIFIYSSKWLNSRSLNRLKVLPKTLYFSTRIELL
jgi:hypothetical protein